MQCMRFSVVNSKMASAKSLEDMLSSEVDESVVSAIVGSLESQLSSPNIHIPSQDIASGAVTANHISSSPDGDGLHDAQKQHGVPVGNLIQVQGNSLSSSTKSLGLTSNSQLLGINSVVSSPAPTTNTLMVTLSGAVPASGYINQMTGTTQQTLLNAAATSRSTNSADIKIVYSQPPVTQFNSSNPTNNNGSVIQTQRGAKAPNAVQNGGVGISRTAATSVTPGGNSLSTVTAPQPGTTLGMSAIQNLANVAAQQTPIIISNVSQAPGGPPNFTIQNQQLDINSKQLMAQRLTVREQLDQKQHVGDKIVGVKSQVIVKDGSPIVHHQSPDSGGTPPPPTVSGIASLQTTVGSSIIVSNTPPTVITVTKPVQSQQHGQPVNVVTQVLSNPNIIPGVQILNMNARPGHVPGMAGQKLSPRVVFSAGNQVRIAPGTPQVIAARPGTPGVQQNTITLQPGMVRGTLLFKTESGQFQVLNVAPGLTPTSTSSAIPGAATYRLQTVQMPNASGSPVVSAVLPQGQPSIASGSMQSMGQQPQTMTVKLANTSTTGSITQPLTIHTTTTNAQSATTPSQMSPNTAKKKCKNFLSTLIRLATDQPEQVATNVKNLIQGLIDGAIMPEDFTNQLQKELNSSPQPCLVPFLKKSLPYLRHSLMTRELTIDGVRPPPPGAVSLPPPSTAIPQIQITQARPAVHHNTVRVMTPISGSALTAQLAQPAGSVIAQQRFVTQQRLHPGIAQSKSLLVTSLTKQLPNTALSSAAVLSPATVGALQSKITPGSRIPIGLASGSKEKEKRTFSSLRDDDDINDVAAMGGVNLVEESQRILAANAEIVGTQIRSCKDENFLFTSALQKRINRIASKYGLDDSTSDTVALISHATQERLKTLVEKLGVIAEHRLENIKNDPRFEVTQDVKGQLKFLEELDRLEKKRHEEQEREILLRAAKSRSKLEDPEQLKLKQKAKEMQRAELEEMRQREANMTALLAIGPRKKQKTELGGPGANQLGLGGNLSGTGSSMSKPQMRPRVKRVNLRDLLFLMEQEKETVRSSFLYKSYFK